MIFELQGTVAVAASLVDRLRAPEVIAGVAAIAAALFASASLVAHKLHDTLEKVKVPSDVLEYEIRLRVEDQIEQRTRFAGTYAVVFGILGAASALSVLANTVVKLFGDSVAVGVLIAHIGSVIVGPIAVIAAEGFRRSTRASLRRLDRDLEMAQRLNRQRRELAEARIELAELHAQAEQRGPLLGPR